VVIEDVMVDGISSLSDARPVKQSQGRGAAAQTRLGSLRLAPGRQRIEIHFTALSFMAPERVRFQYRLEGLETDWVDGGTKRFAEYSFLPPGDYTFRVIAANSDGVWNRTGASIAITRLPYFWQTWWFRLASVLVAGGIVGGTVRAITRQRYRRKLEKLEQQRAIEKERSRIAQDIHDDLGASLTRITLLSQTARSEIDQPAQAAHDLDRIYDTARELTRAMDEIVWAVNPHHDTLDSLVTYLSGFAQDFLSAAGIRCRLDVPLNLPSLPVTAEVRHNLFLAFKEAVNNVVRHSSANEAGVSFVLEDSSFTLAIQDDGRGFQMSGRTEAAEGAGPGAEASTSFGNGLVNMRERLGEIGGSCSVETAVGRGTIVRFVVPRTSRAPRVS
jgi:signal transduction histidine kinase